jgi:hypothetical protein
LVERLVRDEEAVGSNPTSPMKCHGQSMNRVGFAQPERLTASPGS